MPAAIVTPMLIGAAVGAVSAAISGGNILKGALFGALGGAIGGALGAIGGAAGGTTGSATSGIGAEAGAAAGAEAGAGAGMVGAGAADAAAMYGVEAGMGAEAGSAAGAVGGEAAGAVGSGLQTAATQGLMQPQGIGLGMSTEPVSSLDTGLAGATQQAAAPRTFLESLFKDGSSMLNSRLGTGMIGEVLKGYSAGKNQEALIEARREDTRDARANARFGNVGSRFNTATMIGPNVYRTN